MSELKARMLGQTMNEYGCDTKIYLKSEADKVIADKDEEIDKQKWRGDEWAKACNQKDKEIAELKEIDSKNRSAYYKDLAMMAKDVDRQKYKRCLNNAWWCRKSSNAYAWSASNLRGWKIAVYYDKKAELYRKWQKRWHELAEKFKEAKNESCNG